ncbi:ATP-binding protein [Bacillus norwichensis]|uniref:ATP-binding protein n=1 Tax=Bacillus norwichensis TaxID=2762217 RepID=A0ABR8VP39_9BACI|nr:ATP-binding protein [Bacillus norwichensis]MBD8006533.1 ATP-binding protein [Bacillus norwichensis]
MKKITTPERLHKNITYHSENCERHFFVKNGFEIVKPIQKMMVDGELVCPRCELEQKDLELQEAIQRKYDELFKRKKYNIFYNSSILSDNTILAAKLENYQVEHQEERENKQTVLESLARFKDGQVFNVILQGNQGAGKSHLAYAALRELNESGLDKSCLFVNVESMMRLIRDSFGNKRSKYTESYFVELMSEVDYLALDDIGAETGAIGTDKMATDFVQRILYAITTTRQDRTTLITTNLSSETLFRMYDKKLVSRLFRNPKFVVFKETKDKRMENIPF